MPIPPIRRIQPAGPVARRLPCPRSSASAPTRVAGACGPPRRPRSPNTPPAARQAWGSGCPRAARSRRTRIPGGPPLGHQPAAEVQEAVVGEATVELVGHLPQVPAVGVRQQLPEMAPKCAISSGARCSSMAVSCPAGDCSQNPSRSKCVSRRVRPRHTASLPCRHEGNTLDPPAPLRGLFRLSRKPSHSAVAARRAGTAESGMGCVVRASATAVTTIALVRQAARPGLVQA